MPFIKPQEKQSITERSSSDRKSCLVGWKANSSCNKHKMTKLAKGQASKMARRLPEQKSFNTPQRPAQKLLRGACWEPGLVSFLSKKRPPLTVSTVNNNTTHQGCEVSAKSG